MCCVLNIYQQAAFLILINTFFYIKFLYFVSCEGGSD